MQQKILAVYFTQSGQTKQILDSFLSPLQNESVEIEYLNIQTKRKFPFPWSIPEFFDTVPESVEVIPEELEPWSTQRDRYDLIVLAWQPWNLSPSIPSSSILQDPKFQQLLKDTPLITIAGCRNMWINAMEKIKKILQDTGTRHAGNIALVDRHHNHLSYYTIFHWLGTGKKTRKWGIFPLPGVSDEDIRGASVFGEIVLKHLKANSWDQLQPELVSKGATPVIYKLMYIERTAGKIFQKWVNIIRRFPDKRSSILVAYRYYLATALLIVSPVILLADAIFVRPFNKKKIKKQLDYYTTVEYNPEI